MKAVPCILALAGVLSGCGLVSGPGADVPRGAYHLATVDGNALPFTMRDDEEVGRWVLRADTIVIHGGGKAERRRVIEVTGSVHMADTVMRTAHQTDYRVSGSRIEVGFFDCPINALCTPFASGEIRPGGFSLHVGLVTFTALGIYVRSP